MIELILSMLFVGMIILATKVYVSSKKIRVANLRIDGLKEYLYEEVEKTALDRIKISEGLDILRDNLIDVQEGYTQLRTHAAKLNEAYESIENRMGSKKGSWSDYGKLESRLSSVQEVYDDDIDRINDTLKQLHAMAHSHPTMTEIDADEDSVEEDF